MIAVLGVGCCTKEVGLAVLVDEIVGVNKVDPKLHASMANARDRTTITLKCFMEVSLIVQITFFVPKRVSSVG